MATLADAPLLSGLRSFNGSLLSTAQLRRAPGPSDLAWLALIDAYCKLTYWSDSDRQSVLTLLMVQLSQNPRQSWCTLDDQFSTVGLSEDVVSEVIQCISQKCSSTDGLYEFFGQLPLLLQLSHSVNASDVEHLLIDEESLLGLYLRRCIHSAKFMSFEDLHSLSVASLKYVQKESGIQSAESDTIDLDRVLKLYSESGLDVISSSALRAQLRTVLQTVQFPLSLFTELVLLVTENASDELNIERIEHTARRFFDVCTSVSDESSRQFAFLSLAAVYSKIGKHRESLRVLHSTIALARTAKNSECLGQALLMYASEALNAKWNHVDLLSSPMDEILESMSAFNASSILSSVIYGSLDLSMDLRVQAELLVAHDLAAVVDASNGDQTILTTSRIMSLVGSARAHIVRQSGNTNEALLCLSRKVSAYTWSKIGCKLIALIELQSALAHSQRSVPSNLSLSILSILCSIIVKKSTEDNEIDEATSELLNAISDTFAMIQSRKWQENVPRMIEGKSKSIRQSVGNTENNS
ncbi:hypothetical protein GQ42DRAFT_70994 [Ramicandelaber brevisporus]|nr:hypothetical protein GQ42DRAFT_70994 [Ramicandelaber brevisporus]